MILSLDMLPKSKVCKSQLQFNSNEDNTVTYNEMTPWCDPSSMNTGLHDHLYDALHTLQTVLQKKEGFSVPITNVYIVGT